MRKIFGISKLHLPADSANNKKNFDQFVFSENDLFLKHRRNTIETYIN